MRQKKTAKPAPTIHRRHAVISSCVRTLAYDPDSCIMEVEFDNGRYRYYDVSSQGFCELMNAPSIGSLFNRLYHSWPSWEKMQ